MSEPEAKNIQLSENGIIYISSGFDGPYTLQVIASKLCAPNSYQLCLTDGKLYIGGKYTSQNKINIDNFSVVKVQCKFTSRWSPIQILSLSVISNCQKSLLGSPPMNLHDYFLEQKQNNCHSCHSASERSQQSIQGQKTSVQGLPRKRTKLTNDINQIQNNQQQQQVQQASLNTQTQKIKQNVCLNIENIQNSETQNIKFKSDSQSQIINCINKIENNQSLEKHIIQLIDLKQKEKQRKKFKQISSSSEQQILLSRTEKKTKQKVYVAEQHQIIIDKDIIKKNQTHNVYVSQLYQRMLRWKILCRVVNLRTFLSAKGKKCTLLYLIDQKGDQIKAIYYYNKNIQNPADVLTQGKVYSFSGGQVIKSTNQQSTSLQIILDSKCEIVEYESIFIYPFNSKKITKFKDLSNVQQQVNLIGIVKSFQIIPANPSNYKSKPKMKGILCNPFQMYQIQFHKILYGGQKQLSKQSIYVLNNFKKMQIQNAVKLVGSNNSYMVKIYQQDIQYNKAKDYPQYKELNKFYKQFTQNANKWKKYQYYNLSEIKYSKRTISQLKSIANQTDSTLYSEILISIADIKLKKQYMACPVCKRSTIQQQHVLYQCLKCKKIVDPSPTLIVNLILADATGSFQIDVFGQKVSIFIGVESSQFCSLSSQEKQCTLQISKFSQFVVKIKSEKKNMKQLTHSLQQASKQEHTLTMQQIRRRTVEEKLKLEQRWDQYD